MGRKYKFKSGVVTATQLKAEGLFSDTKGSMLKLGTSSAPISCGTIAGMKFESMYVKTSATSGDARAKYVRLYLSGANSSGGGEAIRAFTTIEAAIGGGAHGIHTSLSIGTGGSITGLGCALRATLQVPNGNLAGTTAAVMAEIYAEGTSSNNTGTMAFFRTVLSGNATGIAALKDVFFTDFSGMSAGSGEFIDTDITTHTAYGGLKVNIPSVGTKYIPLVSD